MGRAREGSARTKHSRPPTQERVPRVDWPRRHPRTQKPEATPARGRREPEAGEKKSLRTEQTDPEPGVDSRQATVRNMRSKCRCSCVLQFTFRRAVSCVLHRPPSQVIHRTVSCFQVDNRVVGVATAQLTSRHGGARLHNPGKGERSLRRFALLAVTGAPHPKTRAARAPRCLDGTEGRKACGHQQAS